MTKIVTLGCDKSQGDASRSNPTDCFGGVRQSKRLAPWSEHGTIHEIAAASKLALPGEINQSKIEAQEALSLVRVIGWSKDV